MAKRNINLDIYRSICAMLVLIVHIGNYTDFHLITVIGASGLYGFFVLTGYLAIQSCRNISPLSYYKQRLLRILPVYYLALVIDYIANIIINVKTNGENLFGINSVCGIKNILFVFGLNCWVSTKHYYWWNAWWAVATINSFLFCYLITPLVRKIGSFKKFVIRLELAIFLSLELCLYVL